MTTPRVTEIPLRMAAVERDPFVPAPAHLRLTQRQANSRRLELVRRLLRDTRNARPAGRTERA